MEVLLTASVAYIASRPDGYSENNLYWVLTLMATPTWRTAYVGPSP